MNNSTCGSTPGAGASVTPVDHARQLVSRTAHNPFDLGAGILQVLLYAYTVLGRRADNDELDERLIIVQQAEVLLAAQLGLTIEEFLEALCGQSGFEVLHIRRCEELEVNINMEKLLSSCSRTANLPKRRIK